MKKALLHASAVLWLAIICFWCFVGGYTFAQADAPKMTLEEHDVLATLKSEAYDQLNIQQGYKQRYQDLLNADPGFKEATNKREALEKQIGEEIQKIMKRAGVDPKRWQVDMKIIGFSPVTPEEKK